MSKRARTSLFILLGILFLLTTPLLILYSQGYRLDWREQWFSQVGAFYFSVTPTRAEVFVNGQLTGRTARILGTTLTENFPPDTYLIRIQKEGYHPWEKLLSVSAKQVTEAKHITLMPVDPAFTVLENEVLAFWPSPRKIEAVMQKSPRAGEQTGWTLTLWDSLRNIEYPLYKSLSATDEILEIRWASDSNSFLMRIASAGVTQSFVQRIDRSLLTQPTFEKTLQTAAQLREKYIVDPRVQQATAFLESENDIVWLAQNGILWQQGNTASQATQLNQKPLPLRKETSYAIYKIKNEFFIQEAQTLYLLNRQTQAFEQFFTPFSEMALSPDGKKIALSSGRELWLYYFEEDREQPARAKGERIFLTRFSEDIKNLTWLTSHYLIFTRGDTIVVSEIDTRDHLNIVDLGSFPNPTLVWQENENTLLAYSGAQIRASEKLLP
ncbi:MAG: PEGA domain-containing protein [Candidatus Wildermuthbacteria bacterium]|nr:PEGA domain-containing protein [Candidatus Wildermuthbacteria bacterium]